jgi:hypothetical protein
MILKDLLGALMGYALPFSAAVYFKRIMRHPPPGPNKAKSNNNA